MWKVLPLPSCVSTLIVAPSSRAACEAMASPRPTPSDPSACALSQISVRAEPVHDKSAHGRDENPHWLLPRLPMISSHTLARTVAAVQGGYYFLTGVWPNVHMKSFIAITGPKYDLWLVITVGVLVGAIGLGLLVAAVRNRVPVEVVVIAIAAALGLIAVDIGYVAIGRIPPIYLLDAVFQGLIIAAWLAAIILLRRPTPTAD